MSGLTEAQQRAIATPGNVLVVAGAGTGKTSTLVARCLRLITAGGSLENILMVTFTEAAAAEMRARIRHALEREREALEACDPVPEHRVHREHFDQQLALLDTANISTLHSFCLHLVRSHFHALDLDPQVLVLDERQTAPLISGTLEALLGGHYAGGSRENEAVRELIRTLGRGSDDWIRQQILRLHRYIQTRGDADHWWGEQVRLFEDEQPTRWREWLAQAVPIWASDWRTELAGHAGTPAVDLSRAALEQFSNALAPDQMGVALEAVLAADAEKKNWPRGTVGRVRDLIVDFFGEAAFLRSQFPAADGVDPLVLDWARARQPQLTLLRLTREFTQAYAAAKRELGGVDFADLEQFSLRLLRERAEVACRCQEQFHHIFVDECQDINAAQDAILTALSRVGPVANRFLVGDVKQSIYRFRLANPNIFRAYERAWSTDADAGTCVSLSDNFRSREAILNFVNGFFAPLMRESMGGLAYDAGAHLRFGAAAQRPLLAHATDQAARAADRQPPVSRLGLAGATPRVELHWLTRTAGENGNGEASHGEAGNPLDLAATQSLLDLASVEREARLIALRLREIQQQGHLVWDPVGGRLRPVAWNDMVVLLRSPGSKVEAFAQEFHRAGVPLSAVRGGFFEALEVMDLLNLMRLLDNPLQDVPLLAVLRSALVGLSLEELAEIRAHNREPLFWLALRKFQQAPRSAEAPAAVQSAREKAGAFLRQFTRWRELVRQTSLSHCLEVALAETHYEALLGAEPRGAERLANLRRLLDLARDYDTFQRQGLFRFLRYVDSQQAAGVEAEPAAAPTDNAVRLLSIHKSKGLEFPVVVVADLGKPFNLQGLRVPILLDEEYGLCPQLIAPESAARYPSLPYWLAQRRENRELRGEELRLLYVAMTRARDLLILTASVGSDIEQARWVSDPAATIPERVLTRTRTMLDWFQLWLPSATRESDWHNDRSGQAELFRWRIYAADEACLADSGPDPAVVSLAGGVPVLPGDTLLNEAEQGALAARMAWRYPGASATAEPAKTSVSALRRRLREEDAEAAVATFAGGGALCSFAKPASGLSAADIGIAHHVFLQMLRLDQVGSELDLRKQAAQLQQAGVLSGAQVDALDFAAVLDFWQSAFGRELRAQPPENVRRELPFTIRLSSTDLAGLNLPVNPELPDSEFFVVQGVVDLAVIFPEEIWLLDFKTDQVKANELAEKVGHYAPQLNLYSLALARIYGRPVTQTWLHFLKPRRSERLFSAATPLQ